MAYALMRRTTFHPGNKCLYSTFDTYIVHVLHSRVLCLVKYWTKSQNICWNYWNCDQKSMSIRRIQIKILLKIDRVSKIIFVFLSRILSETDIGKFLDFFGKIRFSPEHFWAKKNGILTAISHFTERFSACFTEKV